jgi:hypothetical protein
MKSISTLLLLLGFGKIGNANNLQSKTLSSALLESCLNEESYLLKQGEILTKSPLHIIKPQPNLSQKVLVQNNTAKFIQK